MIDEDDDLPVLTHILRTGNAATVSLIQREADNDRAEAHAPAAAAEQPTADELVIGNDPDVARDDGVPRRPSPVDELDPEAFAIDEPDFVEHPSFAASATAWPSPFPEGNVVGQRVEPILPPIFESPAADATVAPRPEDPALVAARLRDAVLSDLLGRIGPELDARIAQALHAEVETALGRLQYNLRQQLTDALHDVVARAVAEALRPGAAPADAADAD